ncbi:leishmanolysin family protein, putative [Ichthyophthirius multifiliis]|uniref:Leishmanolysin family protein, putative n=1 Tax=Ichthyophthirius multifiliis TaxID=5932 RepID=G0R5F7_ICHMU|nr:leishmanolysin family protein, putative [Ichthyophthirius multifiliis]EGR27298.1 leishmanolysin family protein, putative [Ichthyophthirius multifiliis]|eukprot:XP_004024182.1 leishmanolysin family protein, putative [Ichthyophthirius multifiliis]
MEISKIYFQKLLKVYPLIGNNIFPKVSKNCAFVNVPPNDQIIGIPNSDLHIYVSYANDNNDAIASATCCEYSNGKTVRPIFGMVQFNLSNMKTDSGDAAIFENDLETTIHEILHILGFSVYAMQFWIDPDTGKSYGTNFNDKLLKTKNYRGIQTTILVSKNVVEVTRKYYNCPTVEGMQLENEGSLGTISSHWEKTVIFNEMMVGDDVSDSVLSIFTIALLKDTGFYTEVNENMADNIFWGKGKGCDFLENACQSTIEYPEYPKQNDQFQCTFEYEGMGVGNSVVFSDGCALIKLFLYTLCTNPNSITNKDIKQYEQSRLSNYSTQSKCFKSTAKKSNSVYNDTQFRCHQFKCSSDASEISVVFPEIDLSVLCGKGEQNIQKDIDPSGQKAQGKVTCPQDYERFCNYTPICPNFCSEKGVCVNGQCICKSGFGGVDCSINCSGVVDNETCIQGPCPQGKFLNTDNTCKSDCPLGSFGRADKCEPCDSSCSRCTGPSSNECTQCQFMTLLQGNQCVDKCNEKQGYFPNQTLGICEYLWTNICYGNCKICQKNNQHQCVTCNEGFFYYNDSKQCLSECPLGYFANQENQFCEKLLLGCLQQNNPNTCSQCDTANGFRLGLDQKCTLCFSPCSSCNPDRLTQCFVCEGSKLVSIDGSCVDECPEASYYSDRRKKCQKCSTGCQKCNYIGCNECYEGYYVYYENKSCLQCVNKYPYCQSCDYHQCNKCINGYQLNQTKKQCIQITSGGLTDEITEKQCPNQCEKCSQPGECLECKAGFYEDKASKSCVKCRNKFSNCYKCTETSCINCIQGFQYDELQKQCLEINNVDETTEIECPNECKKCSKSKICLECQDGFYDYSVDNPTIQTIQCLKCTIKFSKCSSCTPSICLKCFPGYEYYDYEDKCIQVNKNATDCNEGCTLCGQNSMCLKCMDGFYQDFLYVQDFKYKICYECSIKFSNCIKCDSIQCTDCNTGYNLNNSSKQCEINQHSRFLNQVQRNDQ